MQQDAGESHLFTTASLQKGFIDDAGGAGPPMICPQPDFRTTSAVVRHKEDQTRG